MPWFWFLNCTASTDMQCCQILPMADIRGRFLAFHHGQFCEGWCCRNAILRYGGATCWPVWRVLALCHLPSTTLLMWTVDFRNCIMLLWNSFKSQERAVDFRNCIMPSTGTSKWNGSQYNRMHHTATISLFGAKYKLILFYYDYNLHCISHNTCNRNDYIHNHITTVI
jgi:hypothetical protein